MLGKWKHICSQPDNYRTTSIFAFHNNPVRWVLTNSSEFAIIQHSASLFRHKRWDLVKIHLVALGARLSHPICPGYSGLSAGSGRALLAIRLILTKSLGSLYSTAQVYSVTARGFDHDSSPCFKAYGLVWWHGVKCVINILFWPIKKN